ncbi:15887_t:CDS:2, partial [Gigaspora rosea]
MVLVNDGDADKTVQEEEDLPTPTSTSCQALTPRDHPNLLVLRVWIIAGVHKELVRREYFWATGVDLGYSELIDVNAVGIDIVGPLPIMPRANRYIVVETDYMTKWPKAKIIPFANAQEVSNFIFDEIICHHRCSEKLLSDRGTHFCNQVVDRLLLKFSMKHLRTMDLIENLPKARNEAVVHVQQAQARMKERYDKKLQPNPKLDIDDKVLVYRASMEYNKSGKKKIKAALKRGRKIDSLNMPITIDEVIDDLTSLNSPDTDPLPPPFDPAQG